MDSENSVPELLKKLEDLGVSKEQVDRYLNEGDARRAREMTPVSAGDPLESILDKLDKLQESVDALTAKLDRE